MKILKQKDWVHFLQVHQWVIFYIFFSPSWQMKDEQHAFTHFEYTRKWRIKKEQIRLRDKDKLENRNWSDALPDFCLSASKESHILHIQFHMNYHNQPRRLFQFVMAVLYMERMNEGEFFHYLCHPAMPATWKRIALQTNTSVQNIRHLLQDKHQDKDIWCQPVISFSPTLRIKGIWSSYNSDLGQCSISGRAHSLCHLF